MSNTNRHVMIKLGARLSASLARVWTILFACLLINFTLKFGKIEKYPRAFFHNAAKLR